MLYISSPFTTRHHYNNLARGSVWFSINHHHILLLLLRHTQTEQLVADKKLFPSSSSLGCFFFPGHQHPLYQRIRNPWVLVTTQSKCTRQYNWATRDSSSSSSAFVLATTIYLRFCFFALCRHLYLTTTRTFSLFARDSIRFPLEHLSVHVFPHLGHICL